jgi:DNA-binding NtrC family response regulator
MARRILVVDDQPFTCQQLALLLSEDGFQVVAVNSGRAAREALAEDEFQLLITDLRLPDDDGLKLLAEVRARALPMGVIVLTAHGDPQVALEAMKVGADDFVAKPFDPGGFQLKVRRALDRRALMDELEKLQYRLRTDFSFRGMVSRSPRMKRVFDLIDRVGLVGSTVLISGETGTGKELVARAIHAASNRREGPWVAVNCAALSDSLLESELFGHEKGAFTGADRQRLGRFEMADGGTLFLDEIGDISQNMQVKLLRVLQSGQFERLGGSELRQCDVRIVAATHRDLEREVKANRFRRDLFYRLNVVRLEVPALRERPEDVPLLAAHFLAMLRSSSNPPVTEIHHEAMQALLDHSWPGNVRELENAMKAAVALSDGPILHREALPATVLHTPSGGRKAPIDMPLIDVNRPLPELTAELVGRLEREYFAQLLASFRGNLARCARHSGLSRRGLAQKLHRHGLNLEEYRLRED